MLSSLGVLKIKDNIMQYQVIKNILNINNGCDMSTGQRGYLDY